MKHSAQTTESHSKENELNKELTIAGILLLVLLAMMLLYYFFG